MRRIDTSRISTGEARCEYSGHHRNGHTGQPTWVIYFRPDRVCGCVFNNETVLMCDQCFERRMTVTRVRCTRCRDLVGRFADIIGSERIR